MTTFLSRLLSIECAVVILGAVLLSFPWLDRPFFSRGEPREALVAQSMVTSGNWISPAAYDGAVPSKPPFNHWLISLASLPVGEVTETTSRLPTAIAFFVFMVGFFIFVARRSSPRRALLASLILLSSPEWIRSAVSCRVDLILATTMAGGLLALFEWEQKRSAGYLLVACTLLSAATLTKGPVAIVLPVGIFCLWSLLTTGISTKHLVSLAGRCTAVALPVLVVASSWYVAAYLIRGQDFIDKVFYENVQRFASTMEDEPHKHSFLFLLGTYLIGFAPWTIPWGVELWKRRPSSSGLLGRIKGWWSAEDPFMRFSTIVAIAVTLFFCIPSSKRSVYLLPAYPFIAVLLAGLIDSGRSHSQRSARVITGVLIAVASTLAALGLAFATLGGFQLHSVAAQEAHASFVESLSLWRLLVAVAVGSLLWGCLRKVDGAGVELSLARSVIALVVVLQVFVVGTVSFDMSPKKKFASGAAADVIQQMSGKPFLSYGSEQYAASFYLRKQFRRLVTPEQSGLVFVERRNVDDLERFRGGVAGKELAMLNSVFEKKSRQVVLVEALPPAMTLNGRD